jgi:hypothetical protein
LCYRRPTARWFTHTAALAIATTTVTRRLLTAYEDVVKVVFQERLLLFELLAAV